MKLNIGCNKHSMEGYIGVDIAPHSAVDVLANAYNLPFTGVETIYAGHLLEHLAYPIDFFLECWRVLRPGGTLSVVIPDVTSMQEQVVGVLFGFWLDDEGNPDPSTVECLHRSWWNEATLVAIAEICGFEFASQIDRWTDPRLVAGANWQSGASFTKVGQNPVIERAASIHRRMRSET